MSRSLKTVGLLAFLVCLMCVGASAAAKAAEFHSASSTTYLSGAQETENVYTVNGGTIKCSGATFSSGAIEGTTQSSINLIPSYSGCKAFGQAATIAVEGCHLHVVIVSTGGAVSIVLTGGGVCRITIKTNTAKCHITIESGTPSTPTSSWATRLVGGVKKLLKTWGLEGISYTSTGGICGASGTNGKLTGTVLLGGYKNAGLTEPVDIWVE